MYFILDALKNALVYLEKAVIVLLFFVAFKLAAAASLHLTGYGLDIDVYTSLIVIVVTLSVGIVASLLFAPKKTNNHIARSMQTEPVFQPISF